MKVSSASLVLSTAAVVLAIPMPTPPGIPSPSTAKTLLNGLKVATPLSGDGYSRAKFPTWEPIQGTCDTREFVLKRDGTDVQVNTACTAESGSWTSPYDGLKFTAAHDLDIDHLVPLKNAWISGASQWTTDQRKALANDVARPQLWAVSAHANRGKGDDSPDQWKPPLQSFWCTYAESYVQVKSYYKLTITDAEKGALADCPPDPALANRSSFDFISTTWDKIFDSWSIDNGTKEDKRRLDFNSDGKGAAMAMWKTGDAPTLVSNKYILFGKVSVTVQAAKGAGLITAMVLKSDSGDEIDWELLGAYDKQATTNYFYDGQALFNTYNNTYDLSTSSFDEFHTYAVEWTDTFLSFSIDRQIRKIWYVGEIPPEKWPQTPMQVKLGVWAVSNTSDQGEIDWAGGVPRWGDGPFKAYFKSVEIEDYVAFCNDTAGRVEYQYDERTHGWQNVRIAGCKRRDGAALPTPSPMSDQPTATGREKPKPSKGEGDDEGMAVLGATVSSPMAALLCLGWLMVL